MIRETAHMNLWCTGVVMKIVPGTFSTGVKKSRGSIAKPPSIPPQTQLHFHCWDLIFINFSQLNACGLTGGSIPLHQALFQAQHEVPQAVTTSRAGAGTRSMSTPHFTLYAAPPAIRRDEIR